MFEEISFIKIRIILPVTSSDMEMYISVYLHISMSVMYSRFSAVYRHEWPHLLHILTQAFRHHLGRFH